MPTRHLRAVAGLVLLAALLRLQSLGLQSFWLDEAVTVGLVRRSFAGMISALPASESTPPLYYVLAWGWSHLFGSGEVGLRSLSALVGIATIPVAYAAAARLVSPRTGLIVAALAAVNPLLVWYSQEARGYALLVLLAGLSLVGFARLLDGEGSLALWTIASGLALATHYFAAFIVGPEVVWLLIVWRRPSPRQAVAVACLALTGAALLPLALEQRSSNSAAFIAKTGLGRRVLQLPKQDLLGFDFPHQLGVSLAALLLLAVAAWLLARRASAPERAGARRAFLFALPSIVVPLAMALAGADYLITRNLIATWIPLAVVVAAGLGTQNSRSLGPVAAAALCCLGLFAILEVETHAAYQRDDWRSLARAMGQPRGDRAIVIQPLGGHLALAVYRRGLRTLPSGGRSAREIDLVAVIARSGGALRPPRPPSPTPPAGFQVVERRIAETYSLIRMRSPASVAVTSAVPLDHLRLESGLADFSYEPAP